MFISHDSFINYPLKVRSLEFYPSPVVDDLDRTDPDFVFLFTREITLGMEDPGNCHRDLEGEEAVDEESIEAVERLLSIPSWVRLLRLDPSQGEVDGSLGFAYNRNDESVTFDQIKEFAHQVFTSLVGVEMPPYILEGMDEREGKRQAVETWNRNH